MNVIEVFSRHKPISIALALFVISSLAALLLVVHYLGNKSIVGNQNNDVVEPTVVVGDTDVEPTPTTAVNTLVVDVSGAVVYPGTYSIQEGKRLTDAIQKAGGLSDQADTDYYARNYNSSRLLYDQEKIYIPRLDETASGIFVEGRYMINHSLQRIGDDDQTEGGTSNGSSLVNVNTASQSELETLSGIGPVTAQKIIDNRPYESTDDLINKKVVGESTLLKIEASIAF